MKRRYLQLAAAVLVAAAIMAWFGRLPGRHSSRVAIVASEAPAVDVRLRVLGHAVSPDAIRLEKGARVRLSVTNAGVEPVTLALPGYEDRVSIPPLGPGVTWAGEFLADRPGDDFAWVVDGKPTGRLQVLGSHLEEGHE